MRETLNESFLLQEAIAGGKGKPKTSAQQVRINLLDRYLNEDLFPRMEAEKHQKGSITNDYDKRTQGGKL